MPITNSTTAAQNWLWQAEQFLIWNDGIGLPVFYDGKILRRSNGNSIAPISTTAASFTIPPVGQSVSVAISSSIDVSYWGLSFLVNTSQFILQNTSIASTQPFLSVATYVLQSTSGDKLQSSLNSSALLSRSNQYCGWIASTGVVQGGSTITNWQNILAPVGSTSGTPATAFTINFPANTVWDPSYNKQATHYAISVGDTISVNGYSCTVNSLSYLSGSTQNYVVSATCTPQSSAATGQPISGTVAVGSHTWCIQTNQFNQCVLYASSQAGSFAGSGSGAMNGGTSGSGSIANYFTVALNTAPFGLNNGSQYTFQAVSTGAVTVTFTGTINGSSLVNCQMASPPNSTAAINFVGVGSNPTSLNQIVKMTSSTPTLTTVGTVYNLPVVMGTPTYTDVTIPTAGNTVTIPIIVSGTAQVASGHVLQAISSAATGSHVDIFVVSGTSQVGGTGQNYATLVNQTGTVDNTMPNSASIIPIPELPVSTVGIYGMGRNWISLPDGKSYIGCDLVGSSSGTNSAPTNYNYDDAVLKVSQNQFLAGGTTFKIPGAGQKIRAMQFTAQLDASLGQGPLQIFTDDTVFSNVAPTDATTWSKLSNPIQSQGLIGSGGISQTAVAQSNGDLLFRLSDGGVQSMLMARLDFNKWGNTPVSKEISRIISGDNPDLFQFTSMVVINNRMLMSCNLAQAERGVYGPSLAVMNFDPVSSLEGKAPTIWEGKWTGLNVLQMVTGFFNGVRQCYALCLSEDLSEIEVHQILNDADATTDNGSEAIEWEWESAMVMVDPPDYPRAYKRLVNGEFSIKGIVADVPYTVYYRSDQSSAWTQWYVSTIQYRGASDPGYRRRIPIGEPRAQAFDATNNEPLREGYCFQIKFVFRGPGQFMSMRVSADEIPEPEYGRPV